MNHENHLSLITSDAVKEGETKTVYMCLTDFEHELGGTIVCTYPNLDGLMAPGGCGNSCGSAEVEVKFIKVVSDKTEKATSDKF